MIAAFGYFGRGDPFPFTTESTLSDHQIKDRYSNFFEADFMPLIRHEQTQGAPERQAYAAEYTAFQFGEINKKLGRLIELMERSAANGAAK